MRACLQLYTKAPPGQGPAGTDGTSTTTHTVPEWNDELAFGVVSAGKFTRLQVMMRNQAQSVMAATPGLIAF